MTDDGDSLFAQGFHIGSRFFKRQVAVAVFMCAPV